MKERGDRTRASKGFRLVPWPMRARLTGVRIRAARGAEVVALRPVGISRDVGLVVYLSLRRSGLRVLGGWRGRTHNRGCVEQRAFDARAKGG